MANLFCLFAGNFLYTLWNAQIPMHRSENAIGQQICIKSSQFMQFFCAKVLFKLQISDNMGHHLHIFFSLCYASYDDR